MDDPVKKINFIENVLPKLIVERNDDLRNCSIVKCTANDSTKLDGFMSSLFKVDLVLKDDESDREKTLNLMVKLEKGNEEFRESCRTYIICYNEVHYYKNVIPTFQKYLKDTVTTFNPEGWTPRIYYADYKNFPELSDVEEAIIVMENLQPSGFRLGPRVDLDEAHLRIMVKNIAQFHSAHYAMKINQDPRLDKLIEDLKPFDFTNEKGSEFSIYNRLFKIGLERIYLSIEKYPEYRTDSAFLEIVNKLKVKYGEAPDELMQKRFLKKDETFTVLLHGDYNRNNVLFQYDQAEGFENPKGIKMIDFQEARHASSVIDLAFFMYMNMPGDLRPKLWDELLQYYHDTLLDSLTEILKCERTDDRLQPYSFDCFIKHFTSLAFYGAMVCAHFLPWMACTEEQCKMLADAFEDIFSDEAMRISVEVGGRPIDDRVFGIFKHSFEMGYMGFVDEEEI